MPLWGRLRPIGAEYCRQVHLLGPTGHRCHADGTMRMSCDAALRSPILDRTKRALFRGPRCRALRNYLRNTAAFFSEISPRESARTEAWVLGRPVGVGRGTFVTPAFYVVFSVNGVFHNNTCETHNASATLARDVQQRTRSERTHTITNKRTYARMSYVHMSFQTHDPSF